MTSGSTELDEVTRMKTTSVSRRRLRIRRLKYTCRTKTEIAITSSKNGESSSDTHLCVKKTRMVGKEEGLLGESSSTDSIREISLSLSSSLGRASEPKNGIVLSGFGDQARDDSRGLTCGSHGWVSVIGRRREMEDAVKVELGFALVRNEKYDFFGVYDGHGGARVAEACRERLHRVLEEEMMVVEGEKGKYGRIDWERAMLGGFERMDEEVIETGRIDGSVNMIGSTAVVAVVGKEVVVVANCGDSRAVISRGGVSVALSADHKPDRVDELERIESAGGRVINWSGHRVLGVLATSRSIGDQYLKPFIISKPEVTISERTDADEFLILASDGLWDVVSNEAACQVVRRCFKEHVRNEYLEFFPDQCAAEAASVLAELAMARGSRDNVSVIVIGLKKPSLCS